MGFWKGEKSVPAGEVFSQEATQDGVLDWARARSGKERRKKRGFMIGFSVG